MRRAGGLLAQVADFGALRAACRRAARGKRGKAEVVRFLFREEGEILRLREELSTGAYRPGPYRFFLVRDPKTRVICAPCFRDRVVHHALCAALEPIFERVAVAESYACRAGKGSHAAARRARELARGGGFFLKMDVEKFFDSIDRETAKAAVHRLVKDPDVLRVVELIVDGAPPGAGPGRGIPIGALTSQHLANLYLAPLDRFIKQELRVRRYVRYMDDLLLFADDKQSLWTWARQAERFAGERLKLRLKRRATVVAPVCEGVAFLGLRIWPEVTRLGGRRKRRFVARMRRAGRHLETEGGQEALDSMAGLVEGARVADTLRLRRDVVASLPGTGHQKARTG